VVGYPTFNKVKIGGRCEKNGEDPKKHVPHVYKKLAQQQHGSLLDCGLLQLPLKSETVFIVVYGRRSSNEF